MLLLLLELNANVPIELTDCYNVDIAHLLYIILFILSILSILSILCILCILFILLDII